MAALPPMKFDNVLNDFMADSFGPVSFGPVSVAPVTGGKLESSFISQNALLVLAAGGAVWFLLRRKKGV